MGIQSEISKLHYEKIVGNVCTFLKYGISTNFDYFEISLIASLNFRNITYISFSMPPVHNTAL